ncbi:hypothetical protein V4F39_19415 [Aquincola sp. MAHUQ-54]|uniref:Uncharacterized protein n=1 Tax=Aquincola agrisoli TaxID=3119538 RepID=A0AAW9QKM4_9BURK
MERVRHTDHQTLELSGAFGFLELGYAIQSSPSRLTLGKVVERPAWNPLHPGRKMFDWRC